MVVVVCPKKDIGPVAARFWPCAGRRRRAEALRGAPLSDDGAGATARARGQRPCPPCTRFRASRRPAQFPSFGRSMRAVGAPRGRQKKPCPVRVPSAAFNVPLPSLFGHRSNTEITSFPVGSDARRRPFTGATPGLHVSQPGPGPAPRLAFAGSSGGWRVRNKEHAPQSTAICSPVAT